MSKNKKNQTVESVMANPQGKTVEEIIEIIQTLQAQMSQEQTLLNQSQATTQAHQSKILKMRGALEVLLQMVPKERVEKMIQQEAKENHQEAEEA